MGLTRRYGGKTAVNDLSFTVRPGMVTSVLGPNGAGKTNIGIRHFFSRVPVPNARSPRRPDMHRCDTITVWL